jgi:hypothetical protein
MKDVAVDFLYMIFCCDRHTMMLRQEFKLIIDVAVEVSSDYWCCNSYFKIV